MVVSGVIAARLLGPEDRGYLALLVLVPIIVAKVGGLGIPLAVTYYVARDRKATAGIWSALQPLVLFQAGLLAGVHMVALWALLGDEPQYVTDAALYTVLLVPAVLAQDYGLALLQARGRFTAFNVLRLTPIVIYAVGVTVLLVMDLDGLSEIAAVWAGANVVLGALTMVVALSGIGHAVDGHEIPRVSAMVAFGAKGLLGANSAIEYYRVDQAVVGLFLTPIALGLYSVGLAFTNLPRSIANSLGVVAYPHLAEQTDPAVARRKLWRFFTATVISCAAVVAVLEVAAGWLVPVFFGDEFKDSVPIVRIVLVSGLLIAARRILSDGARGLGHPTLGTVAEVVSLVTLAPALAVFLPLWGVEGVAFSLVVAGAASLLVMFVGLARASRDRPIGGRRRRAWRLPRPSLPEAGLQRVAALTAAVLVVDALAVGLTLYSPRAAIAAAGVLGLCLVAVLARRRLQRHVGSAQPVAAEPAQDGLAAARLLYLLGVLLVGFIVIRPAAGLTLSDLLFLGALGLTVLTLVALRRPAPVFLGPVMLLGVVLFAVGGLVSSFDAESALESGTVVARVVYLTVVWFWLGGILLDRPRHLQVALALWVASAALGGAGAIVQTIWGDVIPAGVVHYGRVSGFTYQVNDLGGLCGVAAVPAAMLVTAARGLAARLASLAALFLIVAGLLLSNSVTAMLAAVVAGVVWIAIARPDLRLLVPVAAAVLLLSAFAAGNNRYWESPLDRLQTSSSRSGSSESTLFTRVDSYEAAWQTIQDSPLVGVGLGREAPNTATGSGVHNMFLATWFQAGLIGLLGLVLVVVAAVTMGWRAVTGAVDGNEQRTAAALFAAMIAFLVFGQGQEVLFQRYGWIPVALIAALRVQQHARAVPQTTVPARIDRGPALPAPTG